eukprot:GEMP01032780.1.p1 GENE.GEMP01032780.1~~GEMP01032780.1.p1  ORF type:complete len:457 (-),score=96.72 GEMP01032780.1:654-2024(-)
MASSARTIFARRTAAPDIIRRINEFAQQGQVQACEALVTQHRLDDVRFCQAMVIKAAAKSQNMTKADEWFDRIEQKTPKVIGKMIETYASARFPAKAEELFLPFGDAPPVMYNILMSAYGAEGQVDHVLRMWSHATHNERSYTILFNALKEAKAPLDVIRQFVKGMPEEAECLQNAGAILHALGSCGAPLEEVEEYLDRFVYRWKEELQKEVPCDIFHHLFTAYPRRPQDSRRWWNKMRLANVEPTEATYVCAMKASATAKELDHWWNRGFPKTSKVLFCLLHAYAEYGKVAKVKKCIRALQEENIDLDLGCYHSLLLAMTRNKQPVKDPDEIEQMVDHMKKFTWDIETYGCLVNVYAKMGDVVKLEAVILDMEAAGVKLNPYIYVSWFKASRCHASAAVRAFRHLEEHTYVKVNSHVLAALEKAVGPQRARAMTKGKYDRLQTSAPDKLPKFIVQ